MAAGEEIARCLKNMRSTNAEIDEYVAKATSPKELCWMLATRLNLSGRTRTSFSPDPTEGAGEWLARTVAGLNYGKIADAPFPGRIIISWPGAPYGLHMVDTRGLDAHVTAPIRTELEDRDTVVVLCSSFIDTSDAVLSILDGPDVDSGTAAEIGYAFAKNKPIVGYRGDFRLSADNVGGIVNLQVEYFIRASGGTIVTAFDAIAAEFLSLRAR